jgi:hypothetical protein
MSLRKSACAPGLATPVPASRRRWPRLAAAILGALVVTTASRGPARFTLAGEGHRLTTGGLRRVEMAAVSGEPKLTTAHFVIAYPPGLQADATIVANSLERYEPEVTAHLGTRPSGRVAVRVEDPTGMAATFETDPSDAPLGAYWRGVLWFLAPSAYLPGRGAALAAEFNRQGPVPHEFTHLLDDQLTDGRLPPFLDEGVAQYEEWRDNGYLWLEPDNTLSQPLYSWHQLETEFDTLPNQALAYRQSFLLVRSLGPGGVNELLRRIGAGQSADAALKAVVGPSRYAALVAGSAWGVHA